MIAEMQNLISIGSADDHSANLVYSMVLPVMLCLLLKLFWGSWRVLGIKHRTLNMLGKCCTTELYLQP